MSDLTENQRKALAALCERGGDFPYLNFKVIAEESELAPHLVRRTVRALARKGLVEYARGLWTEDGTPAGSGYQATESGRTALHPSPSPDTRADEESNP